jgi:hypothetical protein
MATKPKTHIVPVLASKLKITATITGLDVDLATAGDAVTLTVEIDGLKLTAPISPKSFRKCQAAIKAGEPGTVMAMLTGELDLNKKIINSAGIVTMVKAPKPPKVDASESADASVPAPVASVPAVAATAPVALMPDAIVEENKSGINFRAIFPVSA